MYYENETSKKKQQKICYIQCFVTPWYFSFYLNLTKYKQKFQLINSFTNADSHISLCCKWQHFFQKETKY